MSQSASAILDIIASEFSSDPNKTDYISFATTRTSLSHYGDQYQMAIGSNIAAGSSEIQRNLIAWVGLELPRFK